MSLYDDLGISADASDEELRVAFRKAAKKAHPDREGGDNTAMAKVNVAYSVLSDPERRAHYDKHGEDSPRQPSEQQAMELVFSIMETLYDAPDHVNLVETIAAKIGEQQAEIVRMRGDLNAQLKKFDKLQKRIKSKAKENLFVMLFDQKRKRIASFLERMALDEKVRNDALVLLKDYESQPETTTASMQVHHICYQSGILNPDTWP